MCSLINLVVIKRSPLGLKHSLALHKWLLMLAKFSHAWPWDFKEKKSKEDQLAHSAAELNSIENWGIPKASHFEAKMSVNSDKPKNGTFCVN